jgi:hypothetical protein
MQKFVAYMMLLLRLLSAAVAAAAVPAVLVFEVEATTLNK